MNPLKGEVPLTLGDGRELVLVLDFEALVAAETAYGKPLAALMTDAARGFLGASRALLYGALNTRQPGMTLADAAGIILSDGDTVTAALTQAAEAAFPKATEGKQGANPPGKTSGNSGAKPAKTTKTSGGKPRARSR